MAIYVPIKGDEVDKKLADFVNNYPDRNKLKIMFLRESEGVYSFGSKKILIKMLEVHHSNWCWCHFFHSHHVLLPHSSREMQRRLLVVKDLVSEASQKSLSQFFKSIFTTLILDNVYYNAIILGLGYPWLSPRFCKTLILTVFLLLGLIRLES